MSLIILTLLAGLLLLPSSLLAEIKRTTTPDEAVQLAVSDLASVAKTCSLFGMEYDPSRYRYVWVQDASQGALATVSYTVNAVISRTDINYAPNKPQSPIQYRSNGFLVRLDLRRLCPDDKDFNEVIELWDKVPNPYFMFVSGIHNFRDDIEFSQIFGAHVDAGQATSLQALTGCINPIIASHSLHLSALSTMDGGLYYEFKAIPRKDGEGKKKKSDFDALLKTFGITQELIQQVGADQWVGQRVSNVTAKPRRIAFFDRPAPTGNIQGWISITYDTFDDNRNPNSHPLLSLLEFNHDGTEVILEQNNGHLVFLLYDGDGNLADEAPPNLVSDTTVPNPHTKRLQAAISCIRCHGGDHEQGWKDFSNDIRSLVDIQGLDIAADSTATALGLTHEKAFELIARLYNNTLDKPLRRAREDQRDAILVATFGAQTAEGLPWSFADVSQSLKEVFENYYYNQVGPLEACRDLGYQVTDLAEATQLFRLLVGTHNAAPGLPGLRQEDFRIGAIKAGTTIPRRDWDAVYIDAATRAAVNEAFIRSQGK